MKRENESSISVLIKENADVFKIYGLVGLTFAIGILTKMYGVAYENELDKAKQLMSSPSLQQQKCDEDLSGCVLKENITFCNGNDTMFNTSDDTCETLPYYLDYPPSYNH